MVGAKALTRYIGWMEDIERAWDWVAALIEVRRELGVDVELDHFLLEGWSWRVDGGVYAISGPDGPTWLPEVCRLMAALAYAEGCIWRTVDSAVELVTWRADAVGFRLAFKRQASARERRWRIG